MCSLLRVSLFLIPLLDAASASHQRLKMTPTEYKAFRLALNGNQPVNLRNALTLLALRDIKSNKFIYVDIPNQSPAKMLRATPYKVHNTLKSQSIFRTSRAPLKKQGNTVGQPSTWFSKSKSVQDLLLPIYRDELDNLAPISKRRQFTKKEANRIRKKRDTYTSEEEEPPVVLREELSFGLSSGGAVLGGSVGGFLDTTGVAALKLIRSLETISTLALSQVDEFLAPKEDSSEQHY